MQQELWHDTGLDALADDVNAAGGPKVVGCKLWPALDPTSAAARMRACLNPDHAQKLDFDEMDLVIGLAAEHGADFTMQFLHRKHGYKAERLSAEAAKKQAKKAKRRWHLEQLERLEDEE